MPDGLKDIGGFDRLFFIPHEGKTLVHAPLRRVSALLNRSASRQLRDACAGDVSAGHEIAELFQRLDRNAPFLPRRPRGAFAPQKLSLLLTDACNLGCLYCGVEAEAGKGRVMAEETAGAAISFQAGVVRSNNFGSLMLYYFGGEPSQAADVLAFCDRRGREEAAGIGRPFRSAMTSNGVMSTSTARWIGSHLDYIVISCDGPAKIQNRLRPTTGGGGSFAALRRSLEVFDECGLPYALRATVDRFSAVALPATVRFFCESFKPVLINLEAVTETGRCSSSGCRAPEAELWVEAVVAAGRIARDHGIGLKLSMVGPERVCRSSCGVADDGFVVASDAVVSSCFQVDRAESPLAPHWAFGRVDSEEASVRIDQLRLDSVRARGVESREDCAGCFAQFHCGGGCLVLGDGLPAGQVGTGCAAIRCLTRWRILEQLRLPAEADRVRMDGSDEDVFSIALPRPSVGRDS